MHSISKGRHKRKSAFVYGIRFEVHYPKTDRSKILVKTVKIVIMYFRYME